jgi:hypothetical protein
MGLLSPVLLTGYARCDDGSSSMTPPGACRLGARLHTH